MLCRLMCREFCTCPGDRTRRPAAAEPQWGCPDPNDARHGRQWNLIPHDFDGQHDGSFCVCVRRAWTVTVCGGGPVQCLACAHVGALHAGTLDGNHGRAGGHQSTVCIHMVARVPSPLPTIPALQLYVIIFALSNAITWPRGVPAPPEATCSSAGAVHTGAGRRALAGHVWRRQFRA